MPRQFFKVCRSFTVLSKSAEESQRSKNLSKIKICLFRLTEAHVEIKAVQIDSQYSFVTSYNRVWWRSGERKDNGGGLTPEDINS